MNSRFVTLLLPLLFLFGCSSLPRDFDAVSSTALENPASTTVGRFANQGARSHGGKSGFALLKTGESAFRARSGAAAIAEKTLDLQYYIWEEDESGRLLIDSLVRAADRGVRVRILVDDLTTTRRDVGVATMNRHPNIEIRMFNPNIRRNLPAVGLITELGRLNRRMHNKVFIADNALAIVGGRNLGNHYFGVDSTTNFRDLDLLAMGPIVEDVSESFNLFWSSEYSIPAEVIVGDRAKENFEEARDDLFAWTEEAQQQYPYPVFISRQHRVANLKRMINRLVWANGELLFDHPEKAGRAEDIQDIASVLRPVINNVEKELLIESAYFIPGKNGVDLLGDLVDRGVEVRVLTNSLASNDVAVAFSGYSVYRVPMLERGIELHELMTDMETAKKYWSTIAADSKAGLHTKAMVFDGKEVFVGSMNLDPRSININTEIGLLVQSPELSRQVAEYIQLGLQPDNSYRLVRAGSADSLTRLQWIAEKNGQEVIYDSEPDVSKGREFSAWLMSLLPIESQL